MNVSPFPRLGRLAGSPFKIGLRFYGSRRQKVSTTEPLPEPPGHGEKVWVYSHISTGQVIHSLHKALKASKALSQLPFNGKKTKPPKLRKDLWRPMAMIQLPEGCGKAGQSIYHKLRELKKLHELSWGDEIFFREDGKQATKKERGIALNNQKLNAIADMAAVLAGIGRGNLIWVDPKSEETSSVKAMAPATPDPAGRKLMEAVVYWENDLLRHHAQAWSPNVMHDLLENVPQSTKAAIAEPGVEPEAEAS